MDVDQDEQLRRRPAAADPSPALGRIGQQRAPFGRDMCGLHLAREARLGPGGGLQPLQRRAGVQAQAPLPVVDDAQVRQGVDGWVRGRHHGNAVEQGGADPLAGARAISAPPRPGRTAPPGPPGSGPRGADRPARPRSTPAIPAISSSASSGAATRTGPPGAKRPSRTAGSTPRTASALCATSTAEPPGALEGDIDTAPPSAASLRRSSPSSAARAARPVTALTPAPGGVANGPASAKATIRQPCASAKARSSGYRPPWSTRTSRPRDASIRARSSSVRRPSATSTRADASRHSSGRPPGGCPRRDTARDTAPCGQPAPGRASRQAS